MQFKDTRNSEPAEMPNGGDVVEVANATRVLHSAPANYECVHNSRPTATGRITHPSTPLATWLNALIATSEEQRERLRAQLAAVGVAR